MENNPLYPPITKKQRRRQHLAYVLNRIFVTCVILSIIVNLASGGAPWCLIVIIGLFTLHTMVVSPDLLEYNRISQTIKAIEKNDGINIYEPGEKVTVGIHPVDVMSYDAAPDAN